MQESFQLNMLNQKYKISVRIDWLYFKPHLILLHVPTPKQTWLAPPGHLYLLTLNCRQIASLIMGHSIECALLIRRKEYVLSYITQLVSPIDTPAFSPPDFR